MNSGVVVAIINNKGGVGKTTITTNLAHSVTRKKKSISYRFRFSVQCYKHTHSFNE